MAEPRSASTTGHPSYQSSSLPDLTKQRLDEDEIVRHIKELVGAQLVVEQSADRFTFRHALTRQAIYDELLFRERRALHREIAEVMERMYTAADESHLADLAHHFYVGARWEKALWRARRMAEWAQAMDAPDSAIQYLGQVLEAAEQLHLIPPPELWRAHSLSYSGQTRCWEENRGQVRCKLIAAPVTPAACSERRYSRTLPT